MKLAKKLSSIELKVSSVLVCAQVVPHLRSCNAEAALSGLHSVICR